MNFDEALEKLNISDYKDRIFNSNSHGELMHLFDYIQIAEQLPVEAREVFREWFEFIVEFANKNWSRPESVYQHMITLWNEQVDRYNAKQV